VNTLPRTQQRRPGRPRHCPDEILERVVQLRISGAKLREICAVLNGEKVPTPGGHSLWRPKTVHDLLHTIDAEHLMAGRPVGGKRHRDQTG
jgi:recombinase